MEFFSYFITLFLILDPFGNMPFTMVMLKDQVGPQYRRAILREVAIAYVILVLFLLLGPSIFQVLHISTSSLYISGGIILFLIALKMIFSSVDKIFDEPVQTSHIIVPIATPSLAGPASIATVTILAGHHPEQTLNVFFALSAALLFVGAILFFGEKIKSRLGDQGVIALERLTGMLLIILAVEMILNGIRTFVVSVG